MQKLSSTNQAHRDCPGRSGEARPRSSTREAGSSRDCKSHLNDGGNAEPNRAGKAIRIRKPIVYIAGPYRARTIHQIVGNIAEARQAAALVWSIGGAALCPHLNTALMDGVATDADFLSGDIDMMRMCDAVYLMPRWRDSEGATMEAEEAKRIGMTLLDDECKLRRWIGEWTGRIAAGEVMLDEPLRETRRKAAKA